MFARPPMTTCMGKCWMNSVETESTSTREGNADGKLTWTRPNQDKVGARKLEHFESLELVPVNISVSQGIVEKDWMKEIEIVYTREDADNLVDPLGNTFDSTIQSQDEVVNGTLQHFVTGSLTCIAEKMHSSPERESTDEEWMAEVEIEYTRQEDLDEAVDPLGDTGHKVLEKQKNIIDNTSDYADRSTDETEYLMAENSSFEGNNEVEPKDSTVLYVDVYAPKPQDAHVTDMISQQSSSKELTRWTSPENRMRYACRLCNYRSHKRYDLQKHCRAHHGEKSFESALKAHIGRCGRGKPGVCSVCGQRFSQMGLLVSHMKTHKRKQLNVRNRLSTKSRCRRIRSLKNYKRTSASARAGPISKNRAEDDSADPTNAGDDFNTCDKDPLCYNEAGDQEDDAAILKPHACKSCEYRSSRRHDLKKHELSHNAEKPHQCTRCSYRCKRAGYIKIHMRIHNDNLSDAVVRGGINHRRNGLVKLHDCTICHYRTRQMGNMRVHMQTHTGEKPFVCSFCHKRFTQAGSLKIHVRGHTGEKPYLCNVCGQGFTQIANRNCHKKTCPYSPRIKTCDICNFTSTRNHELVNHMKIHSSIRVVRL